ncbi:MAG TPA: YggT family protein [Gallionella sp.]|nr:YggT family protein [Gallionella sp.]
MFNQVIQLLLDIFVQGFAGVLLFRFLLQWLRAPMRNPVGEFIMAISDFAVLRARRYIPPMFRLDSASLLLALVVELIYLGLTLSIDGYPFVHFPLLGLSALSIVKLIKISVYLLMSALVAQAILSWVNPFTPLAPLLAAITYRFLRPIQRILPLVGNVDLSPLVLLVICQIILLVPLAMMESLASRLL